MKLRCLELSERLNNFTETTRSRRHEEFLYEEYSATGRRMAQGWFSHYTIRAVLLRYICNNSDDRTVRIVKDVDSNVLFTSKTEG